MKAQHSALRSFWKEYRKLPKDVRKTAKKQYRLLRENSLHPSLHFKEVNSRKKLWSARVNDDYRAVALKKAGKYIWLWIGNHATYDRLIK